MGDSRKVRFKVRGDTVRVSCNAQADIAMCVFSQPERAALATLLVCGFGLEGVCRNVQLLMDMDMVGFILGL